jgi:hypothetical protein
MIKTKYNKKRNTAFLYEALVRELTKAALKDDVERATTVTKLVKEHFKKGSLLYQELYLYRTLLETRDMAEAHLADRLIQESKFSYAMADRKQAFNAQTRLITVINKKLGSSVYNNFVPNYRDLGTIHNVLQGVEDAKSRVLVENDLVNRLCGHDMLNEKKKYKPIDALVYRQFVKKFNDEYGTMLSEGQKKVISQFVISFADDGIEFKMCISERLTELKSALESYKTENPVIAEGIENITKKFNNFENLELNEELLLDTLKLQSLVEELRHDNSN